MAVDAPEIIDVPNSQQPKYAQMICTKAGPHPLHMASCCRLPNCSHKTADGWGLKRVERDKLGTWNPPDLPVYFQGPAIWLTPRQPFGGISPKAVRTKNETTGPNGDISLQIPAVSNLTHKPHAASPSECATPCESGTLCVTCSAAMGPRDGAKCIMVYPLHPISDKLVKVGS